MFYHFFSCRTAHKPVIPVITIFSLYLLQQLLTIQLFIKRCRERTVMAGTKCTYMLFLHCSVENIKYYMIMIE